MPVYFGPQAPTCPVSRDQPIGSGAIPAIRSTIPPAFDLASAIAAANLARSILNQIIAGRVINNVFPSPNNPQPKTIDEQHKSRWVEQTAKRVTNRYIYYAKDAQGNKDTDTWVVTQRIDHAVWYDQAWRTYLVWDYGDKGEGELVSP